MNNGEWDRSCRGRREQLRTGNLPDRDAQEKNGARQMLRGVDLAMDLQNLLGRGDSNIIESAESKMSEPRTEASTRRERQLRAAVAAMQIHGQFGMQTRDLSGAGRKDVFNIRIALKERRKGIFDDHAEFQIRPGDLQQMQGRRREDTIPE